MLEHKLAQAGVMTSAYPKKQTNRTHNQCSDKAKRGSPGVTWGHVGFIRGSFSNAPTLEAAVEKDATKDN